MRYPRLIMILVCIIGCGFLFANDSVKIVFYNVENLFDTQHDTLKNDSAFLPDGAYHWNHYRYYRKLDHIAQVITNIAGWGNVPIVGLCEVENAHCLQDLCKKLRRLNYNFVHYESYDERGIDVALLYDTTAVKVLSSKALKVDLRGDKTRDILYVQACVNIHDTLHIMVCHLPSQLGGSTASEWKRTAAKQLLQQQVDSILRLSPSAKIVIMGDMNSDPKDDLFAMSNKMLPFVTSNKGTHKYQGIWSCLDQFYVSHSLKNKAQVLIFSPDWLLEEDIKYLDFKPRRNYSGYRYQDGYSDHLPIILTF